jgi:NAD-dependent SIR2 family protein deacetylase
MNRASLEAAARAARLSGPMHAAAAAVILQGKTWAAACSAAGVTQSGLLKAMRRMRLPTCPHCGQRMPLGTHLGRG